MLQRHDRPVTTYAYLLSIEVQDDGPTEQRIINALSDAVRFMEGTGQVDVDCLGRIDTYEEPLVVNHIPHEG